MRSLVLAAVLAACGGPSGATRDTTPVTTAIGETHTGEYALGPVAFSGSYTNSCGPYPPEIEKRSGDLLAGLALRFNGSGALCDACIRLTTAKGRSVTARVITTGDTRGPNDVDLSQQAFDAVNLGEYPRTMTWQLVACPPGGAGDTLQYQFQTESNPYWTSFWVRNARLPLRSVEATSHNHKSFVSLDRGPDGTLTDASGFGEGPFTVRVTAYDGQVITDTFPSSVAGKVLSGAHQFQ